MSDVNVETSTHQAQPFIARSIHRFSVPIILGWVLIVVALALFVPPLEQVEAQHLVSLTPTDAPSVQALNRLN
jgi:putative drug exporter of the RND superfamily